MRSLVRVRTLCSLAILLVAGCSSILEPGIMPATPEFLKQSLPPDTVDRGINAEISADTAIRLEWHSDPSRRTDGYVIFRSEDDTIVGDFLKNGKIIAEIISTNQLFDPLDTVFVDTVGVKTHQRYFYQIQAYNSSPPKTYSQPTPVTLAASYYLTAKPGQSYPTADGTLEPNLPFAWVDPDHTGVYQVIVRRVDNHQYVWSSSQIFIFSGSAEAALYGTADTAATPLISGMEYEWRVKAVGNNAGNTSKWQRFRVQ